MADYASTGNRAFLTRDGRPRSRSCSRRRSAGLAGRPRARRSHRALDRGRPAGLARGVTGEQLLAAGAPSTSQGASMMAEAMIGAAGALIVLLFLFASFLALLPLLIGGVSVLATFLIVGGLTEITGVSQIVEYLIALIGLGVAIDYSLLVVTRWREERAAGRDNAAAVAAAMEHAGPRGGVLRADRRDRPAVDDRAAGPDAAQRRLRRGARPAGVGAGRGHPAAGDPGHCRAAARLAAAAHRAPRQPAVLGLGARRVPAPLGGRAAGLGVMAPLMLPALSLHLGLAGQRRRRRPAGPAHNALITLTSGGVPSGVLTPAEVLNHGAGPRPPRSAAAGRAAARHRTRPWHRAGGGLPPRRAPRSWTVLPATEWTLPAGQSRIASAGARARRQRPDVIGVGGAGASLIDFDHAVYGDFPLMLALIAVATFLLLTRAFRSVVLAAKAVLFNLISLAAAFGVLTWVWQDGHGSQAVWGIPATGAITMWVPLMVFAFLFGLSMDYEVFILTRIREAYDATGDAAARGHRGLGRTGRLVTGAAAILMLCFLSMSTGPQTDLKILATGLGAGILIDALVIRCLLVPAMVALFGRANWWLPAPLARLLRISAPQPGRP